MDSVVAVAIGSTEHLGSGVDLGFGIQYPRIFQERAAVAAECDR